MKRWLILIFSLLLYGSSVAQKLEIYQIGISYGHATLLVAKDDDFKISKVVLIDAGPALNKDVTKIKNAINNNANGRLDAVFITHYHNDHMGGLVGGSGRNSNLNTHNGLLQWKPNVYVYDRGNVNTQEVSSKNFFKTYTNVINASRRRALAVGQVYFLFDHKSNNNLDIKLTTIANNGRVGTGRYSPDDENNRSAVFLVTFGKFSFLVQGDKEGYPTFVKFENSTAPNRNAEDCNFDIPAVLPTSYNTAIKNEIDQDVCLVLQAHHGSKNGNMAYNASVALVGSPENGRYDHPHEHGLWAAFVQTGTERFYCTYMASQRKSKINTTLSNARASKVYNANGTIKVVVNKNGQMVISGPGINNYTKNCN